MTRGEMTPEFRMGDEVCHVKAPEIKGVVLAMIHSSYPLAVVMYEDGDRRHSPLENLMYWNDEDEIPL